MKNDSSADDIVGIKRDNPSRDLARCLCPSSRSFQLFWMENHHHVAVHLVHLFFSPPPFFFTLFGGSISVMPATSRIPRVGRRGISKFGKLYRNSVERLLLTLRAVCSPSWSLSKFSPTLRSRALSSKFSPGTIQAGSLKRAPKTRRRGRRRAARRRNEKSYLATGSRINEGNIPRVASRLLTSVGIWPRVHHSRLASRKRRPATRKRDYRIMRKVIFPICRDILARTVRLFLSCYIVHIQTSLYPANVS